MAPLTPSQSSALNISTPQTSRYDEEYHVTAYASTEIRDENGDLATDSLKRSIDAAYPDRSSMSTSPRKQRHSRVLSGTELSPLKILSETAPGWNTSPDKNSLQVTTRSPRKTISPVKRFPVKVSAPPSEMLVEEPEAKELTLEDAIRENAGLEKAIQIFEDEDSARADNDTIHGDDAPVNGPDEDEDMAAGADDTIASAFSTFSAVPNMTMFAKLTQNSPSRMPDTGDVTPRAPHPASLSRTPSRHDGNTTNNLLDFTDQLRFPQKTPSRGHASTQSASEAPPSTPARQGMNLIDFDIPPMPTPRSIPSITPRELESLKSSLLSEISSLKASLSGKEAEVHSLKTAVADAERRAGESTEHLREERTAREQAAAERDGWERRGAEMEQVLRKAKEEIMLGQREREELEVRVEEADKRREAAEMMAQEAESKMAGMRAGKASEERAGSPGKGAGSSSAREVEAAVEKVARELHALYKSKHETKVAALRKSYENRWEKRVRELETKMTELSEDNERLRLGRDATMTRVEPVSQEADEERRAQAARDSTRIGELTAEVEKLEAIVRTVKADNGELRKLLERERVEKGELVQLAEEMMSMQGSFVAPDATAAVPREKPAPPQAQAQGLRTPAPTRSQQAVENLRGSISRASGLRAPGSYSAVSESRIGRAGHERARSNGLPRPGQKSGLQSAIEKMGSHRRE